MSLVVNRVVQGPATHALVIGVGAYEHVGASAPTDVGRTIRGLTSPPVSAVEVARHLAERHANPKAALATVELLVSSVGPLALPEGWSVGEPSFAGIREAFDRWIARGDADPDNVLLFYFCGHGFQKSRVLLLPSDFAESPTRPWERAIDIQGTRLGARACRARTQIWLIDACRSASAELLRTVGDVGQPLAQPTAVGVGELSSSIIFSASDFRRAAGLPNQPSRFTRALLDALQGPAVHRADDRWRVGPSSLHMALNELMARQQVAHPGWPEQRCEMNGHGTGVLTEVGAPRVPLRVRCNPSEVAEQVTLELTPLDGEQSGLTRAPAAGAWETEVAPRVYELRAIPAEATVADIRSFVMVMPPGGADEELVW